MTDATRRQEPSLDSILDLFGRGGAEVYLGEEVTLAEHMLQTAALAEAEGASDALVTAALLHDVGHLAAEDPEDALTETVDRRHDVTGAAMLEALFPPVVVACVRLHVAAKRYLCSADPRYAARLSPASRHSLSLQGGPMSAAELAAFCALPFHHEAVRVRRWDDAAKSPQTPTPTVEHFRPLLERLAGARLTGGSEEKTSGRD